MPHNSSARTRLGVAPLCAIDATPEQFLGSAARAGFDFVGIRLTPVTPADITYVPGGPEFRRLQSLLGDTGLDVLDVEVFAITPSTTRDDWMPILEMAGELGATLFNVVGDQPDLGAFADTVGQLSEDARQFSITPVIEPIAYRPMNSYALAVEIARSVGCAVELDGLHVVRTAMDVELVAQNRDLFPILQLCDAPAEVRSWDADRPASARPGDSDMVIESRLNRLLPGKGAAPLAAMRDAVAPGTSVSLEIPNLALQAEHDVDSYMALLFREGRTFVGAGRATA